MLEHKNDALGQVGQPATLLAAAGLVHETAWSLAVELLLPGVQGVLGHANQGGKVPCRQTTTLPGVEQEQALFRGTVDMRLLGSNQTFAWPTAAVAPGQAPAGWTGHGAGQRSQLSINSRHVVVSTWTGRLTLWWYTGKMLLATQVRFR